MASTISPKEQAFSNILIQIKLYIEQKDYQSLQYLVQGEDQDNVKQIIGNLTQKQRTFFQEVILKIKSPSLNDQIQYIGQNKRKVKAVFQQKQSQSQSEDLEIFQKQFSVSGIIYGQNYSYPFLGLIQKMSRIYFAKSHPNPFPEPSLKMVHSLIQTLFTFIFDKKVKQNYDSKKGKQKKNINHFLKEYSFFVFEKQYQKFVRFNKLFKNIKNSISRKQNTAEEGQLQRSKLLDNSPLTSTLNLQQLEYLEKISDQIKNQHQFKQFTKIKSLNFLYFGEKRLRQLIDPSQIFLTSIVQKQVLQLISFIICRFVRKVILECIKQKKNGKLQFMKNSEHIQAIDVKIIGNQKIDVYSRKVDNFLKLDQPVEQIAKRTFLQEFYQYEFQKIIPKSVIQQSQKALLLKNDNTESLPSFIWANYKQYQTLWIQRIAAQEYVREEMTQQAKKREKGKNNQYSKYLKNNLKQFEQNSALLWMKYLKMSHGISPEPSQLKSFPQGISHDEKAQTGLKTRKKVKLQSLYN